MKQQKLTELLRHAYQWGRDNGSNRSEKNFNDFLKTEAVKQALSTPNVSESFSKEDLLDLGGWFDGSPEFVEVVVNDWLALNALSTDINDKI